MAVSSVLALSTAAGVVVAPQLDAVAHADSTVDTVSSHVKVYTYNNAWNTFDINTTSTNDNGTITMDTVFKLTGGKRELLYAIKGAFYGIDKSKVKIEIVRGQYMKNGGATTPFYPDFEYYGDLYDRFVGNTSYPDAVYPNQNNMTVMERESADIYSWHIRVTGPADAFEPGAYVALGMSMNKPGTTGSNPQTDSTDAYGAVTDNGQNAGMGSAKDSQGLPASFVNEAKKDLNNVNQGYKDRIQADLEAAQKLLEDAKNLLAKFPASSPNRKAAEDYYNTIAKKVDELEALKTKSLSASNSELPALNDDADAKLEEAKNAHKALAELADKEATDLNAAKQDAIATIKALPNLTDAQKADYIAQVNAAEATPAIDSAVAAAKKADADALAAYKAQALAALEDLPYLTAAEKKAYADRINAASTIPAVAAILGEAAKASVKKNPNLSDEKKEELEKAIDDTVGGSGGNVPSKPADIAQPAHTTDELDAAKEAAKKAIDELKNLTDAQKDAYKAQVDEKTTPADVQSVVDAAKKADADALAAYKLDAIEAISNLPYLTADEKKAYIDRVTAASDIPAVAAIVAEAAKASVQKNPNLSDEEKTEAEKAIDDAIGGSGGNVPSKPADIAEPAHSTDDIDAAKEAAKKAIDELKNLTDAEKDAYKAQVDEKTTPADVQSVVDAAKKADADALAAYKAEAVAAVEALPYLTDAEKKAYEDRINAADSIADVAAIVAEAAKASVQKNPNLSDEEKTEAEKAIDDAIGGSGGNVPSKPADIAEPAHSTDDIDAAKEAAKKAIDDLKNLSDAQKADYKAQVDEKTTAADVQSVVDAAKKADAEALAAYKAEALTALQALPYLTDAEKKGYADRINAAGTIADVAAILGEAAKASVKNNPNLSDEEKTEAEKAIDDAIGGSGGNVPSKPAEITEPATGSEDSALSLAQAKEAAKKAIDELKNLTDAQKQAYKAQVDSQTTIPGVIDVLAAATKADINANPNLTDDQKKTAAAQVDTKAAEAKSNPTAGNIAGVVTPATNPTATDTTGQLNLTQAKEAAKKAIDELKNLTDAQKAEYKAQVDAQTTIAGVIDVLAAATKADINANPNLTADQKKAATEQVDTKAAEAKNNPTAGTIAGVATPATSTDSTKADAIAAIEGMEYLTEGQKQAYIDGVKSAASIATIISIVREAARANVDQNPTLTAEEKATAKAQIDGAATIDDLEAYAGAQHGYSDGEVTNNNTTTVVNKTTGSSSSKVPWWVYLLTVLGIGGGVAGWGYVHDADFRAVVDGAIANFQRAVDNALGIRR